MQGKRLVFILRRVIVVLVTIGLFLWTQYLWERRPTEWNDSWFKGPPETLNSLDMQHVSKDLVLKVQSAHIAEACHALVNTSSVALTDAEVLKYCGGVPVANRSNLKPYFIRCVCVSNPTDNCSVLQKGDSVWMRCGMLTHYHVDFQRMPAVVYLATPPSKVYITFSLAE